MYEATLARIESRGWVDWYDHEYDISDSYEDSHSIDLVKVTAETPEAAVEALFAKAGNTASLGTWKDKKFSWETEAPEGSFGNPSTRYGVTLFSDDDYSWWLADEDDPTLWAEVGRRLGVDVAVG
jgi:hypothetical protein